MWQIFTLPVWVIYQNFWFLWMFTVCATFFFIWCASCFLQRIYLSGFGLSFKSTWRRHGCHRNNANILTTTTCARVRGRTCVWVCVIVLVQSSKHQQLQFALSSLYHESTAKHKSYKYRRFSSYSFIFYLKFYKHFIFSDEDRWKLLDYRKEICLRNDVHKKK